LIEIGGKSGEMELKKIDIGRRTEKADRGTDKDRERKIKEDREKEIETIRQAQIKTERETDRQTEGDEE
jgi:hypothetical protein